MRRSAPSLVVLAGVMAILAAIATHALAQPATRPLPGGLRPALEDTSDDDQRRDTSRRPARRGDQRSAETQRGSGNADVGERPRFGNPPGYGAARTGFVSTNIRRSLGTLRGAARRPGTTAPTSSGTTAAPLSLAPPGVSATTGLPLPIGSPSSATSSTTSGTVEATAKPLSTTAVTAAAPAPTGPRSPLLRIPDGTATGGIAGTVNTARLTTASATLLRRRTAAQEDAFAPLGERVGAFLVLPALEVTGGYDTNPARVPNGKSSFFTTASPELIAKSDWTRHEVTATLRGSYTAYDKTPELDRPSVDGKVTGRLDVSRTTPR